MKTSELLQLVAPGKEWSLIGEPENELQYVEGLTWISKGTPPTWAKLKEAEPQAEYDVAYKAVSDTRQAEYQKTSDPIYFQWQRGTKTEKEWLDAVAAIDAANPYPLKPTGVK